MTTVAVSSGEARTAVDGPAGKLRIVRGSVAAEGSVTEVARWRAVHSNSPHPWRKRARIGVLQANLLGGLSLEAPFPLLPSAPAVPTAPPGMMEIEFACGAPAADHRGGGAWDGVGGGRSPGRRASIGAHVSATFGSRQAVR